MPSVDVTQRGSTPSPLSLQLTFSRGRENAPGNADGGASLLRKSVGSTPRAFTVLGGKGGEVNSSGLTHELTRLRNELRAKQRDVDALHGEVTVLKGSLATREKALGKAAQDGDAQAQRLLTAEGALATKTRALGAAEADCLKLRAENVALGRAADKLTAQLAAAPKGSSYSEAVAALEAEVKGLKAGNQALSDDCRGYHNQVRAKDKELDALEARAAEAQGVLITCKEQANTILDLRRQLAAAGEEQATLQASLRQRGADVEEAQRGAAATAAAMEEARGALAAATRDLKAAEARAAGLATEGSVLREELTRVQAVAARATMRELQAGGKDEGVVPVIMHLEEVRFLRGDLERLQEKLAAAEKGAAASASQKEALHKRLDAALAAAKTAAAKPPPGMKAELEAARSTVASQAAEMAALRDQVEKAGPRVAVARGVQRRLEREVAALSAQLREAGLQPVAAKHATP